MLAADSSQGCVEFGGERLLEPIMLRFEHDHLLREPLDHLRAEGFEVERSKLGIVERVTARKLASA